MADGTSFKNQTGRSSIIEPLQQSLEVDQILRRIDIEPSGTRHERRETLGDRRRRTRDELVLVSKKRHVLTVTSIAGCTRQEIEDRYAQNLHAKPVVPRFRFGGLVRMDDSVPIPLKEGANGLVDDARVDQWAVRTSPHDDIRTCLDSGFLNATKNIIFARAPAKDEATIPQ